MKFSLSNVKNLKRKVIIAVVMLILMIAAALFLYFASTYTVDNVSVLGNTRYTDEEVIAEVQNGLFANNTILLSMTRKTYVPKNLPFIEEVEVDMVDANSIRITVQEVQLIGYIQYLDADVYFDMNGTAVETKVHGDGLETNADDATETDNETAGSVTAETSAVSGTAETAADGDTASETWGTEGDTAATEVWGAGETGTETSGEATGSSSAVGEATISAEEVAGKSADSYVAALTQVPEIIGLEISGFSLKNGISIADTSVFNTIQAITRMINRYDIVVDNIEFDEDMDVILNVGNIQILLGQDELIEEKIGVAAAILPSIEGTKGILHLEDYDGSSSNVVFTSAVTAAESVDEVEIDPETGEIIENSEDSSEDEESDDSTDEEETSEDTSEETSEDTAEDDSQRDYSGLAGAWGTGSASGSTGSESTASGSTSGSTGSAQTDGSTNLTGGTSAGTSGETAGTGSSDSGSTSTGTSGTGGTSAGTSGTSTGQTTTGNSGYWGQ